MSLGLCSPEGVFPVQPDLQEDGEVDEDLEGAADDELDGCLPQVEVRGLEDVAASPHQHHANARRKQRKRNEIASFFCDNKSAGAQTPTGTLFANRQRRTVFFSREKKRNNNA